MRRSTKSAQLPLSKPCVQPSKHWRCKSGRSQTCLRCSKSEWLPPIDHLQHFKEKTCHGNSSLAEGLFGMFFKWAEPSETSFDFAGLPYVNGFIEPLQRLLWNNRIRVVTRPKRTLHQEFPSPKFRPPSHLRTNVVYKIPCSDCS